MPIDLNGLRATVAGANDESYIRMSSRDPERIVNYGKSFLVRKLNLYTHGTAEQNMNIREQFYNALQGDGNRIQEETLRAIREQLGINEQGTAVNRGQLKVRTIKQVFSTIDKEKANYQARKDFLKELKGLGFNNEYFTERASSYLGLNDDAECVKPLEEYEKQKIIMDMRKDGRALFDELKTNLGIPDLAEIKKIVGNENDLNEINITFTQGQMGGIVSARGMNLLKNQINTEIANSLAPKISQRLDVALEHIWQETGKDCTKLKDAMLNKVLTSMQDAVKEEQKVITDMTKWNAIIDDKINSIATNRIALIKGVAEMGTLLKPAAWKGFMELATQNFNFRKLDAVKGLAKFTDIYMGILEYSHEENPTMKGVIDIARKYKRDFNKASAAMNEVLKGEFGGDDTGNLTDWLSVLSKNEYMEKYHKSPELKEPLKNLMQRYLDEIEYLSDNKKESQKAKDQRFYFSKSTTSDFVLNSFAQNTIFMCKSFGITIEPNSNAVKGVSEDVGNFLYEEGIAGKRESDPYDKVIHQKLGSLFQRSFVSEYKKMLKADYKRDVDDYAKMFDSVGRDMERTAVGLQLGDHVVSKVGTKTMEGGFKAIEDFFEADKSFGKRSARIVSGIVHQGLVGHLLRALNETGEACGGGITEFTTKALDIKVDRIADGKYTINVNYEAVPESIVKDDGKMQKLDLSRSKFSFNTRLLLELQPKIRLTCDEKVPPELRCELYKQPYTTKELELISDYCDKKTCGYDFNDAILSNQYLSNDEKFKSLLANVKDDPTPLVDYLNEKVINQRDVDALRAIGLNKVHIRHLMFGLNPEARLTKELMNRLLGNNRTVREEAFAEIKQLCQKIVDKGWHYPVELSIDDLPLVKYGGLRMDKENNEECELTIVRDNIKKSNEIEIGAVLDAFNSNSTQRIAFAKMTLANFVKDLRARKILS